MKIIVTENQERLDKYLANNTENSRSTIIKMLDNGFIKVNGKIEKPSYKTFLIIIYIFIRVIICN